MPAALKALSVYVAIPSMGTMPVATVRSLIDTQQSCQDYDFKIEVTFVTGSLPHQARTIAANSFLASGCNRLFWIDSDIVWTPVDFFTLLAHSLKYSCVVGVYPTRREPTAYFIRFRKDDPEPDEDGLIPIDGTGLGFACIHRTIIEQVAATRRELIVAGKKQKAIFRCDDDGVEDRGEDYAFMADVQELGYTIYADTSINLGHVGAKVYQRQEIGNGTTSKSPKQ